jgi:hypothetical protein
MRFALSRLLTYHFYIDAVRIQYVGRVIVRVITRSDSGWAIVCTSGVQRCQVEGVDYGALLCGKRDMGSNAWTFVIVDPKTRIPVLSKTVTGATCPRTLGPNGDQSDDIQRRERPFVKASRRFNVLDGKFNVI